MAKQRIFQFWSSLMAGWLVCFLIGCFVGVQLGLLVDHGCKLAGAIIQVTVGTVSCRWGRWRQVVETSPVPARFPVPASLGVLPSCQALLQGWLQREPLVAGGCPPLVAGGCPPLHCLLPPPCCRVSGGTLPCRARRPIDRRAGQVWSRNWLTLATQ